MRASIQTKRQGRTEMKRKRDSSRSSFPSAGKSLSVRSESRKCRKEEQVRLEEKVVICLLDSPSRRALLRLLPTVAQLDSTRLDATAVHRQLERINETRAFASDLPPRLCQQRDPPLQTQLLVSRTANSQSPATTRPPAALSAPAAWSRPASHRHRRRMQGQGRRGARRARARVPGLAGRCLDFSSELWREDDVSCCEPSERSPGIAALTSVQVRTRNKALTSLLR